MRPRSSVTHSRRPLDKAVEHAPVLMNLLLSLDGGEYAARDGEQERDQSFVVADHVGEFPRAISSRPRAGRQHVVEDNDAARAEQALPGPQVIRVRGLVGIAEDKIVGTVGQPRQDVDGNLPTPNHAFLVDLPELGFGTHRIAVYAAESQGNVAVLIGSKSVTNKRPVGAIEAVNGTTLTGWAADPDRLGESLLIKVYVNGALALTTTADDPRDDLAGTAPLSAVPGYTSYGYSISLAGVSGLASGANQVDVFAVDLNNGKISPLGSRVITV